MVQVLEKREMEYELIIIPAKEEKIEKKAEIKQVKKKKSLKKHAKQHEALVNVNNIKNKAYGNILGFRNVPY